MVVMWNLHVQGQPTTEGQLLKDEQQGRALTLAFAHGLPSSKSHLAIAKWTNWTSGLIQQGLPCILATIE